MTPDRFAELSDDQLASIDAICIKYERALQAGDDSVTIEKVVDTVPAPLRESLLKELLATDVEHRSFTGALDRKTVAADYGRRFPDSRDLIEQVLSDSGLSSVGDNPNSDNPGRTVLVAVDETDAKGVAGSQSGSSQTARLSQAKDDAPEDMPAEFGRYRVERLLGRGGMGAVYLARDTQLDRLVAIKVPDFTQVGPDGAERFLREARAMATVEHPNLCPIFDVGEIEGRTFLSMAYIEGRPLTHYLAKGAAVPPREAAAVIRKLAAALDAAHQAGIVHRDLKPANVMINSRHEPIVMDFGLAQRKIEGEATLTHEGAIVGSPAYMSPEQVEAQHDRIGPATDVHALGVMLFEMLCGQRPFEGSAMSVLGKIAVIEPPKPGDLVEGLDPTLAAICQKAMAKQVEDRFASAGHLAAVLAAWLQDEPVDLNAVWTPKPRNTSPNSTDTTTDTDPLGATVSLPRLGDPSTPQLHVSDSVNSATDRLAGGFFASFRPPATRSEDHSPSTIAPDTTIRQARRRGLRWVVALSPLVPVVLIAVALIVPALNSPDPRPSDRDADVSGSPSVPVPEVTIESVVAKLPRNPTPTIRGGGRFVESDQIFSLSSSNCAVSADLDNDGDQDLVVSDEDGPCRVLLNDGTGVFERAQEIPVAETWHLALGDLDADGDHDILVVANSTEVSPSIWLNNGSAEFSLTPSELPALPASEVALGDLDGDGDLDAWIACMAEPDRVLLNDGNGVFSDSEQRLGTEDSRGVALADFDGDGHLDAFVASYESHCRMWLNDGNGTFARGRQKVGHEHLTHTDVVAGDFNNDGHPDVYVTRSMKFGQLWLNLGAGEFELHARPEFALGSSETTAGDLNGDGMLDIVVANGRSGNALPIQVLINDGAALQGESIGFAPTADVSINDFDGDGDLDLYLANRSEQPDQLLFNQSTEPPSSAWPVVFRDSGQSLGQWYSEDAELGDVDGDGDLDLLVANYRPDAPNNLWLNDGTGMFTRSESPLDSFSTNGVELGDLDGDGDLDAFFKGRRGANLVWMNDGHGVFTDSGQRLGNSPGHDADLIDVDGDGDLDAITMNFDSPGGLWINDGSGMFTDSGQKLGDSSGRRATTGDVDGDGDIDLILLNVPGKADELLRNDGHGVFTSTPLPIDSENVHLYALGDVDGDLDLDLLVTFQNNIENQLWLNDGTGEFTRTDQRLSTLNARRPNMADLDGDGHLDLIIANTANQPSEIWFNDGEGRFSEVAAWLGNLNTSIILPGDLDGDGDLDLVEINTFMRPNHVWFNEPAPTGKQSGVPAVDSTLLSPPPIPTARSTGLLADSGQELDAENAWGVAVADLDRDGDLDAVIADRSADALNHVWLNDGDGQFSAGVDFGPGETVDVQLGDMNGDGNFDAVTASNDGVAIWINDGQGQFSTGGQQSGTFAAWAIALGDVDDDGHLDVVAGTPSEVRVLKNDRAGGLRDTGLRLPQTAIADLALADLDGDGDLDVFACSFDAPNRVWLNDGSGQFHDTAQQLGSQQHLGVALGDADGDGDVDAWVVARNHDDRLWLNNGQGLFTPNATPGNLYSRAAAMGDLNGDGTPDLLAGNGEFPEVPGANFIALRTGNGRQQNLWFGNEVTVDIALGDFDGDGDLDVLTANQAGHPSRVWFNRSRNEARSSSWPIRFKDTRQHLGQSYSDDVVLADVDGDGDIDAVVGNNDDSGNRVWLNDGRGFFGMPAQTLEGTPTVSLDMGDLDADGDLDIFIAGRHGPNRVWLNDGAGLFSATDQQLGSSTGMGIVLGDVDGDGDLDAVVANEDHDDRIWLNDGKAQFTDGGPLIDNSRSRAVVLVDLDGDDDVDAVFAGTTGQCPVWLNDGNGVFTESGNVEAGNMTSHMAAGDVDNDGDIDLLLAIPDRSNELHLNDGHGKFTRTDQHLGNLSTHHVELIDLDLDGDLDVVTGNLQGPVGVWKNDGAGQFDSPEWVGLAEPGGLGIGDLNGDGTLDFFIANYFRNGQPASNSVWLGKPRTNGRVNLDESDSESSEP